VAGRVLCKAPGGSRQVRSQGERGRGRDKGRRRPSANQADREGPGGPRTAGPRVFAREGLDLSRSTLCDWVRQCHELGKHVVEAMWEDALLSDYVAVDATGVLVQQKEKCRRGHFWVLCSENDHVLFRYSRRHNRQTVSELLGSYKGYIQADAATVYDFLFMEEGCTEVGCWSHARRRFFDALSTDRERALVALGFIRKLYRIDREMREMKSEKPKRRARERRKRAGPVLEKFFEWADATALEVLPESPIGKAITYQRGALPIPR